MKVGKKRKLGNTVTVIMLFLFLAGMITTIFTIFGMFFQKKVREKQDMLAYCARLVPCVLWNGEEDFSDVNTQNLKDYVQTYMVFENNHSGEIVNRWLANGKDETYETVYKQCSALKSALEVSSLFIYQAKQDASGALLNDMVMVLDASSSRRVRYDLGDVFGKTKAFETVEQVYRTGEPATYDEAAVNYSGFILISYAPVKDADGNVIAVAGAEITLTSILMSVIKDNWMLMLDEIVDFLVLGVAVTIFIKKRIVKPVGILSSHMRDFVADETNLTVQSISDIHTNDELEQMADDFNALAWRIVHYAENLEEKTAEDERIKVDLTVARQIRNIISSETAYPAFPERTSFDLCLSLKHTIYNKCSFCKYFFTDTNRLCVVVGEALGENLASLIFSALSVSYIKSTAKMGFEPYKVAAEVNNNLCSIEKKDKGLTVGAVIADIDLQNGVMRYINAGMPPILFKEPGEAFAFGKARLPFSLGQMPGISFQQHTIRLCQGSTVLFTSYGVSEMRAPDGEDYSMQRLLNSVNCISAETYELDRIIAQIEDDLERFRNDAPIQRDTTILGFRYFG